MGRGGRREQRAGGGRARRASGAKAWAGGWQGSGVECPYHFGAATAAYIADDVGETPIDM